MRRCINTLPVRTLRGSQRFYSKYIEEFKKVAEKGLSVSSISAKGMTAPIAPIDGDWGWKIGNSPGSNYVTLQRRDEIENIDVNVMADLSFDDLTMHGGQCGELFYFVVILTTDNGSIRFRCLSSECTLRVISSQVFTSDITEAFAVVPTNEDIINKYSVPSWDDQDSELVQSFQDLLDECGINDSFLNFLAELLQYKELVEYPSWWASISAFIDHHRYPNVSADVNLISDGNSSIIPEKVS